MIKYLDIYCFTCERCNEQMSPKKTASKKKFTNVNKDQSKIDGYAVEKQVGHLLRRAHQRHCAIFANDIGKSLTPVQFAALSMIDQCQSVSQNHLGRLIAMDPATIQGVVGRLSERKLVKSKADPDDRRRQLWCLTAKGRNLLSELIPAAEAISGETLAPLSAREKATFMKLLEKIS